MAARKSEIRKVNFFFYKESKSNQKKKKKWVVGRGGVGCVARVSDFFLKNPSLKKTIVFFLRG